MKKFYETPAVEFTGFNAEDVITTSVINTVDFDENATKDFATKVNNAGVANTAVSFGSYQW